MKCSTGSVGIGVRLACKVGAGVGGCEVSVVITGVGELVGEAAGISFGEMTGAGVLAGRPASGPDRVLSQAITPTRRAIKMTRILGIVDLLIDRV
jgi:hypothetical protein